jgi:hypothetical protein
MRATNHPPVPRFILNEDRARSLLGDPSAAAPRNMTTAADSPPRITADYNTCDSTAGAIRSLILLAHNTGLITGPGEIGFDYVDDENGTGYSWMVTLGNPTRPLQLISLYTDISHLGSPAARGLDAALAVLAEAATTANDILDTLGLYTATLPRTVYVVEHADPKTGTSIDVYPTGDQADAALAGIARQNWARTRSRGDPASLDDQAVTAAYLAAVDGTGEYATVHQLELVPAAGPAPAPPAAGEPDDDAAALDAIAELMDGRYWDTETVMAIAADVRGTGRQVREDDFMAQGGSPARRSE